MLKCLPFHAYAHDELGPAPKGGAVNCVVGDFLEELQVEGTINPSGKSVFSIK
ncbi:hypothetical protein LP7551_03735 [Roseibium album]|nr:hypothetical protein LP7551_03735 [Roseibium album]